MFLSWRLRPSCSGRLASHSKKLTVITSKKCGCLRRYKVCCLTKTAPRHSFPLVSRSCNTARRCCDNPSDICKLRSRSIFYFLGSYINRGGSVDEDGYRKFVFGNGENNAGDLPRYYFFRLVFDQLEKEGIKGELAELGVYKGNTAFLLAHFARRQNVKAYLLDTFEGFSSGDLTAQMPNSPCSLRMRRLKSVKSLVGSQNVEFIQGYFPDFAERIPLVMPHLT